MSGDRTKLPKWAQQELEVLEANVAYWQAKALADEGDSDTAIRMGPNTVRNLGDGVRVLFGVERSEANGHTWHRGIEVRWDQHRGHLDITGDRLAVFPSASNHLTIKSTERDL